MSGKDLRGRLGRLFGPGGPLGPPTARELAAIYHEYGLDPASAHPRVFESESLSYLRQDQVLALFRGMGILRRHRVLSLGEGNGATSRLLAKTAGCRVTGVDFNARLVASARSLAKLHGVEELVEYFVQDVGALRLGTRRFDRLYAQDTMCHWRDKERVLRRALPCLQPGALIGIHDCLRGDRGGIDEGIQRLPALARIFPRGVWFQTTLAQLRDILRGLGLEILSAEDMTDAVDESLRKRLAFLSAISRVAGERALSAARSFRAALPAHYAYLRYGRVIARKR